MAAGKAELGAETGSAFTTPVCQDGASGSCGLSGAKTVRSGSFYFAWLVCTFHDVVLARTDAASPGQTERSGEIQGWRY